MLSSPPHLVPRHPLAAPMPRTPRRVAVVVNGRAKSVNDRVIRDLQQLLEGIPDSALYVSRSLEQARFVAHHIVSQAYDVVMCGGGDGTFSQLATEISALRPQRMPTFGVLRLGTGNALAQTLGASTPQLAGLAADLMRARSTSPRSVLPVLRVEGRLAPFAGLGLDSLILSDYNATKSTLRGTPLEPLGQGTSGYALAIAARSLWRFILHARPEVVIRNAGEPAHQVDLHGRPTGHPVPRGEILYQGPVALAAASTIPFYGFGLRLFPQALFRRDRFQLRVADVGALSTLLRLPALFRGTLRDDRIHDFLCSAISIEISSPTPLQIGGDEVGERELVHIDIEHLWAVTGARRMQTLPEALGLKQERTQRRVAA